MKKVLVLLLLFVLASCNKKDVVFTETFKDFPDKRWALNDTKTFKIDIKEDVKDAGLYLHFSHVFEPQYKEVPVAAVLQAPDGKQEHVLLNLKLEDAKGNSLSDCAGDVCDFIMPVKEHLNFVKGEYKLVILNKFNGDYIPNVLALGVSIEKEN
ncbi:MAG: hypothetical protein V4581_19310 [Bacteroidota bacterium]